MPRMSLRPRRTGHWILSVETRPDAIAYCLPAGKILVTSALFDRVKLGDDEFAAIVAHVIAHALIGQDANDAVAAYERTRGTATPDPDANRAAVQLADALAKLIASDHYDAAAEQAADTVALELMAGAGINPGVVAGAWRKVAAAGGSAAQGHGGAAPGCTARTPRRDRSAGAGRHAALSEGARRPPAARGCAADAAALGAGRAARGRSRSAPPVPQPGSGLAAKRRPRRTGSAATGTWNTSRR